MTIELYGMGSPNVRKVSMMLEELELPYVTHYIDMVGGAQFTPEFLALNPNNKVPVIVDPDGPDGKPCTVFESGAILFYLAEKTGRFLPEKSEVRYQVMQWLMFQMAGLGPMAGQLTHFMFYAPEGIEYSLSRYKSEVARLYAVMNNRLSQARYLGGDDYSIADIATFPWVALYREKHGMDQFDHPHLVRWINEISVRPGAQRTAIVFDALTAAHPSKGLDNDPEGLDRFFGRGKFAHA